MVRRFYCDHCNKSGSAKARIVEHEKYCVKNPGRACRDCYTVSGTQQPTEVLVEAMERGGLDELKTVASECPGCILTGLVHWRAKVIAEGGDFEDTWIDWDYKTAIRELFASPFSTADEDL